MSDWQKEQGAKCACKGSDDYCSCQNVRQSKPKDGDRVNFKAVRAQLEQAELMIRTAAVLLRRGGMPENADEVMIHQKKLRVWTQPDGWLDMLEKQQ